MRTQLRHSRPIDGHGLDISAVGLGPDVDHLHLTVEDEVSKQVDLWAHVAALRSIRSVSYSVDDALTVSVDEHSGTECDI